MADIIPPISVILILLLIISIPVEIRIKREDFIKIEINFMLFGAHFSFGKSENPNSGASKKGKNLFKRRLIRSLPLWLPSALRALDYLIAHSRMELSKFDYTLSGDDYAQVVQRYSKISLLVKSAAVYLYTKTASLKISKAPSFSHDGEQSSDTAELDAKIELILLYIPAAAVVFFFDIIKRKKFTGGKGNVGKQNE